MPGFFLKDTSHPGTTFLTTSLSIQLPFVRANYAEVEDLLPAIVGSGDSYKDIHIYGFETELF